MRLILEEVVDSGTRIVAEIDGHSYRIGRDLTTDIALASSALSRQHGIFYPFVTGWLYKDLGSTNGSWQNGNKLDVQRIVGLKEGDYLQLADVILKTRYAGERVGEIGARLFVLKDGEPLGEFPFSHSGGLIEFGGRNSQFAISGYLGDPPGVRFNSSGPKIFVEPEASMQVRVNNVMTHTAMRLSKGDYLVFGEYEVMLYEGSLAKVSVEPKPIPPRVPMTPQVDLTAVPESRVENPVIEESRPQVFSPTHTIAIHADKQRILRFGDAKPVIEEEDDSWVSQKPQQRILSRVEESASFFDFDSMSDSERRLVLGIIFFLGSSLLLFLIWLIFL